MGRVHACVHVPVEVGYVFESICTEAISIKDQRLCLNKLCHHRCDKVHHISIMMKDSDVICAFELFRLF